MGSIKYMLAIVLVSTALEGCGAVPTNVVQGGIAGVELAICIVHTAEKGYANHENEGQITADCFDQCGADAATVARVLDANTKLMLAERAAGKIQ